MKCPICDKDCLIKTTKNGIKIVSCEEKINPFTDYTEEHYVVEYYCAQIISEIIWISKDILVESYDIWKLDKYNKEMEYFIYSVKPFSCESMFTIPLEYRLKYSAKDFIEKIKRLMVFK